MNSLAVGASTQSRAKRPLPRGWQARVIARRGASEIWGVPGGAFELITWVLDQGAGILGYTSRGNIHTKPLLARVRQMVDKTGMHGPGGVVSELELMAAELLLFTIRSFLVGDLLSVRFFANGGDACDAAVRICRAITGRERFISVGYHGASVLFAHSPQDEGTFQPRYRHDVAFGDTQALARIFQSRAIACVIVEVPSEDENAKPFLRACRLLCDRYGAFLILDEVVTGFRLCLGGAAEYYETKPDFACYGKAMSNGRGISALVGPAEGMEFLAERVFHSATYNGDPLNCAHLIATLEILRAADDDIYEHIWTMGERLKTGLQEIGIPCVGHAPRTALNMPEERRREFCARMIERGIIMDRPNYITVAHRPRQLHRTLEAAREVWRNA